MKTPTTGSRRPELLLALLLVLCPFVTCAAWEYDTQSATVTHSVQIRAGADITKKWNNGLKLGFNEDLRFDVYNSENGAAFKTSFTTLSLGYAPVEYVKFDAGYTLKFTNKDTTAVNKLLRHRVFASVTGSYPTRYFKLSLRERALMEARTDSVNTDEKSKYAWQLRSKITGEFIVPGKPVKPYLWVELVNTLNAPEFQQKDGRQFISQVRTQAGVKWRLAKMHSLDFYYRFTYGYDRDINVNKKYYTGNPLKLRLTEETLYQHAIGITYNLDW